ncbi:ABC transporter ATP-binding protein [Bacteroidia bacterium]|nr:ABC transporter ATP-binding protein [Bacteroidia bacterium]
MEKIFLHNVLPDVFNEQDMPASDLWRRDICFAKGDICLVEAVSGAGKSSLCSYIYGYRNDYSGYISFDDEDLRCFSFSRWSELRRQSLSILFQELRLFPELTAMENVVLKNELTAYKEVSWIHDAFERLELADKKDAPVSKLSFGQQQRVALIRTLCQPIDFLFLDEPVSHLDEENNKRVGELLLAEVKAQGVGMVVTSIGKQLNIEYTKKLRL